MPDEYDYGDPYGVEENLETDFHHRRLEITLELLAAITGCRTVKILDAGCGEGHFTAAFKMSYPHAEITALDRSLRSIRKARVSFPDIKFLVCDAHEPPFVDKYFDVMICNNLWEHVAD